MDDDQTKDDSLQPQNDVYQPANDQSVLPQDGATPAAPADDVVPDDGALPVDHPTTDSGLDSQQVYDEGVQGATEANSQTVGPDGELKPLDSPAEAGPEVVAPPVDAPEAPAAPENANPDSDGQAPSGNNDQPQY